MGVPTRRRARSVRAARRPAFHRLAVTPVWERHPRLVVAALAAMAAALDIVGQSGRPLWQDEACAYWIAHGGVWAILHGQGTDGTPPAYYLLLDGVLRLFGGSEFALRLLSLVAGVALVPAMYAVMRGWASIRSALIAAALTAISPLVHYYAVEARNYALLQFETVVIVSALIRASAAPQRIGGWILLAAAQALQLLTHIYGVFLLPGVVLASAAIGPRQTRVRRVLSACAASLAAVLAAAPWIRLALASGSTGVGDWIRGFWTGLPPSMALLRSIEVFGFGARYPSYLSHLGTAPSFRGLSMVVTFGLLAVAFVPLGRAVARATRPGVMSALLALVLTPLVAAWAYSAVRQPLYLPGRYDTIVLPLFLMVLAVGFDRLITIRGWLASIAAVCVLVLAALSWAPELGPTMTPDPEDRLAGLDLAREAASGDVVVSLALRETVTAYYASRAGFRGAIISFPSEVTQHPGWYSAERMRARPQQLEADGEAVAGQLIAAARDGHAVWILGESPTDIDRALLDPLMKEMDIDEVASDRDASLVRLKLHAPW